MTEATTIRLENDALFIFEKLAQAEGKTVEELIQGVLTNYVKEELAKLPPEV